MDLREDGQILGDYNGKGVLGKVLIRPDNLRGNKHDNHKGTEE